MGRECCSTEAKLWFFFFFFCSSSQVIPIYFDISQSAEFWLRASYQKREEYFLGIFPPCGNVCFVEKAAHMQMSNLTSAAELVVTTMWWATGTFNKDCYLIKRRVDWGIAHKRLSISKCHRNPLWFETRSVGISSCELQILTNGHFSGKNTRNFWSQAENYPD